MTHEPEITAPVDLCTPDGARLHPAARGWSRVPLHRANLDGEFGRNKRWDYWAVLAGDLTISAVYSNVDYIGLADVYWADLTSGEVGGWGIAARGGEGLDLPERPGTAPLLVDRDGLNLASLMTPPERAYSRSGQNATAAPEPSTCSSRSPKGTSRSTW
jgi:hypothetical protein